MTGVQRQSRKLRLLLLASLLALTLAMISSTSSAQASDPPANAPASVQSVSNYCGGWLYPNNGCGGAERWLYEVYGWGDQGGVCVQISNQSPMSCTPNAGQGVYSGTGLGYNTWGQPFIVNYSGVLNFVHGVALTY